MKYYIVKSIKGQACEIWVKNSGAWTKGAERGNINKTREALEKIGGFDCKSLKRDSNIDGVLSYELDIENLKLISL